MYMLLSNAAALAQAGLRRAALFLKAVLSELYLSGDLTRQAFVC
jgi:hypothetical protein